MKLKIGDKVKIKYSASSGKIVAALKRKWLYRDKEYTIHHFCDCNNINCRQNREVYLNESGGYISYENDLELFEKKIIKNDIDWLNAIKDNFKDGI